jgi:hypothetical protein
MFTLLPRIGVGLPGGAGTLRFGMSEQEAERLVSALADVRAGWVCGAAWSFSAGYRGLGVGLLGGLIDHGRESGLAAVVVQRQGDLPPRTPSDVPVVWNDIDLFGYPSGEVIEMLMSLFPQAFHPPGALHDVLAAELGLSLGHSDRHGRRHRRDERPTAAPRYLDSVRLVDPERWP